MARLLKCNSCGATYSDTRASGSITYFHACPPQIVGVAGTADATGKIITPTTFVPTPNPRNENLMPDPNNPGAYVMISPGSGITEIA